MNLRIEIFSSSAATFNYVHMMSYPPLIHFKCNGSRGISVQISFTVQKFSRKIILFTGQGWVWVQMCVHMCMCVTQEKKIFGCFSNYWLLTPFLSLHFTVKVDNYLTVNKHYFLSVVQYPEVMTQLSFHPQDKSITYLIILSAYS